MQMVVLLRIRHRLKGMRRRIASQGAPAGGSTADEASPDEGDDERGSEDDGDAALEDDEYASFVEQRLKQLQEHGVLPSRLPVESLAAMHCQVHGPSAVLRRWMF